jgi:regulator of replication initiation timing
VDEAVELKQQLSSLHKCISKTNSVGDLILISKYLDMEINRIQHKLAEFVLNDGDDENNSKTTQQKRYLVPRVGRSAVRK